jgi:hypothetical protein
MECARQRSGEYSVANMVLAYEYAENVSRFRADMEFDRIMPPTTKVIVNLGMLVEPHQNSNGFRRIPVTIRSQVIPVLDWERSIHIYCESWSKMTPQERYREFEIMHPFIDGNGRVGAILYNWERLNEQPRVPPDLF